MIRCTMTYNHTMAKKKDMWALWGDKWGNAGKSPVLYTTVKKGTFPSFLCHQYQFLVSLEKMKIWKPIQSGFSGSFYF